MEVKEWVIRKTELGEIIVQAKDGSGVVVSEKEKDIGRAILFMLASDILDAP